jgi:hypothetical protein
MTRLITILMILFSLQCVSFALPPLSKKEKASLKSYHSILKKGTFISKKSSLKALQAKMKEKAKKNNSIRAKGGF